MVRRVMVYLANGYFSGSCPGRVHGGRRCQATPLLAICAALSLHRAGNSLGWSPLNYKAPVFRTSRPGLEGQRPLKSIASLHDSAQPCEFPGKSRRRLLAAPVAFAAALWAKASPTLAIEENPAVQKLRQELNGQVAVRSPGQSWAPQQLLPNKRGLQMIYPQWLEGRWGVRAKFIGGSAPLGKRFVGPSVAGSRKGTIVFLADVGFEPPEMFEQRFMRSEVEGGVVADRAFNIPAQLKAFWPQVAGANARYDPEANPIRLSLDYTTPSRKKSTQGLGGTEVDSPSRVKRAVELFINNREGGFETEDAFICSEFYRQSAIEQAVAYDYKTIMAFQRKSADEIFVKLRVGAFLNPNDALFFEAGDRAVVVYDYALRFQRVRTRDE